MSSRYRLLFFIATLGLLSSSLQANEWTHYGGDAGGNRFSALSEITPANVDDLEEAWVYSTGDMEKRPEAVKVSAFEGTPILVEGSLIVCTPFNEIVALNPGTGVEMWRFDPGIATDYRPGNQFACRGVSYWRDGLAAAESSCASRVFMGTADSRLISVDARTGAACSGFGDNGQVKIDPGMDLLSRGEFQMTSPPVLVGDIVIVGSAISDNQRADAPKGTVRAFDARTGAPRWTFDPVARGAAEQPGSWLNGSAERTGHANVWAPMSVDEKRGWVFLPTSSPSPDFFGGERPGDNRYANSVVALDGATGEVQWHFQTVHHDIWDYDLPAQPSLVTLQRPDGPLDAVVQVTKTGFVFVLNRENGEPIFGVEERSVPQDGPEGEWLSPTQPYPVAPPPLVPQTITAEEGWGITPYDEGWCEDAIASYKSQGLFTPPSTEGTLLVPFTGGGANWGGMAYNAETQLMYINTSRAIHVVTLIPAEDFAEADAANPTQEISAQAGTRWAMKREMLRSPFGLPCNPPPFGMLHAIDLSDGTIRWESILGTVEDIAPLPIPWALGTPSFGGPLVTSSGVLFIGAAMDNYLRAFDATTGEELWAGRLPAGGQATPMTYEWEGRQYVVIAAGGHSFSTTTPGDEIIAFALPE